MSIDYKYKPEKHKFWINTKTIDELHKEHIDEFKKNKESIPDKKVKLQNLEKELKEIENVNNGKPINLNIDMLKKRNNIKRLINTMKDEINKTENFSAEMDYFSRTGDVIYDYYDLTNGDLYGKNFDKDNINEDDLKVETDFNGEIKANKIEISNELMEITNLNRKRKINK